KDTGAAAVEEDGQEPGGDPEYQVERGDPTEQERHRRDDKGNPHGHQVVEIGRGWGRGYFGFTLRFRFGLRRHDVALRLTAFVAEQGVGRQLSAAGTKFRH